ncbi:hypothetical protein THAOC_07224, partial [Thalassiosira oceanica]
MLGSARPASARPTAGRSASAATGQRYVLVYAAGTESELLPDSTDIAHEILTQHKKICKLLNAGKGEQFVQPGADEWTEQQDIDALHHVTVMHKGPKPCADMYLLFKGASRGDAKRQVAARAKKMRDLARILISQNKMDTVHQVFYRTMLIMLRDEPWRVEQPYSPLLALLQSGLDLSHISLLGNSGASHLCSLAQESSATSTSRNRNQVTIGRQLLEIGGANPNIFCGGIRQAFPLYNACYSNQPTNLEFIELLLEHGADRNMECQGSTAIMGAFDMSLDAIKLLITFEHANCPPIDINRRPLSDSNATALDFTRINIVKFTRFRDEVAITGKAATNCYKTWTTVEPFNVQIEKLKELEALLLSKGAIEGDDVAQGRVESFGESWLESTRLGVWCEAPLTAYEEETIGGLDYELRVAILGRPASRPSDLLCILLLVGKGNGKGKDLPFDVSRLFGIEDLIRGKTSPSWYRKNPAHIKDASTRMLQAFEGRPHLHCAHSGVAPAVGLKVKVYIFLPNHTYACLAGQVTEALPVPTEKDLKRTKRTENPTFCTSNHAHFPGANMRLMNIYSQKQDHIWIIHVPSPELDHIRNYFKSSELCTAKKSSAGSSSPKTLAMEETNQSLHSLRDILK